MIVNNPQLTLIATIKEKIRLAQYGVLKNVNAQLIRLYWDISKDITERNRGSWNKSKVKILTKEIQKKFHGINWFSERNLIILANSAHLDFEGVSQCPTNK